jgi:hypothetical protein
LNGNAIGAIANGGTGQTTRQAAINALAGATTGGYYLRGDGTNVGMAPIQGADISALHSQWVVQGLTLTYISATQFSVPGDESHFPVGIRVAATVSAGTIYGTVSASNYESSITTVTVAWDSTELDSGLSSIATGIITPVNTSFPLEAFSVVGEIRMYGGSAAPAGYFLCDGTAKSRTVYSALFSVIGTTYGAGDGSTPFTLPDLRGRMPLGAGQGSGLTNRTLGDMAGGEAYETYLGSQVSNQNPNGGRITTDDGNSMIVANSTDGVNPILHMHGTTQLMNPFTVVNFIIKY